MAKTRKDINALSADELGDYIHALDILRARSAADPDDPTGLDFQVALHNDGFVGPCEHGNDKFMPWHRAHLHYFEKLLQGADPPRTENVAVPYWDWIHTQAVGKFPPAFDEPALFSPGRSQAAIPLPPDTLSIVTLVTDQKQFAGYPEDDPDGDFGDLEFGPHNDMHSEYIKGKMGSPGTAAEDPIYFSFHCFIDLMWAVWQERNGNPPVTTPDADLRGFLDQPQHTNADFQSPSDLDYEYELSDQLKAAFAVPLPDPEPRELLVAQPLSRAFDDLRTELRETERLQFRLAAPPPERKRVVLRIQALKVPIGGNYTIRGYLHPDGVPFDADDEEFVQKYSVGYCVMWRMHTQPDGGHDHAHGEHGEHGGHGAHQPAAHHPTSATIRFDATAVLAAADAEPADHVLTLQYIPAAVDDDSPPPPELVDEVDLEDVLMEVYG
ncbi:MAG: tyrosinase family protein [Solirubrobacteraceae bacterium]